LQCIGHIINLVVQAFLFTNVMEIKELELYNEQEQSKELRDEDIKKKWFCLLGPLGQGHNIVSYICSTAHTARFKQLAGRLIPMDNCTRWNS